MWMDKAQEGLVEGREDGGGYRVRLVDGSTARATPSRPMRQREIEIASGDAVLLRPGKDGFEIVMRRRLDTPHRPPLLVPTWDPAVEYLLAPGDPKWIHPYLPYLYDWYDEYDADLPLWHRLAKEARGPILELGCGTGRILRELARAGHEVVGLDISQAMIDRAAEKLSVEDEEVRARVRWVHGDMAEWASDRRFTLAFIACNSLHYMTSISGRPLAEIRQAAANALYRHLEPGGLAAISNVAPLERTPPPETDLAPYLVLSQAGVNPNTGLFTAEYVGQYTDDQTGRSYDGPWRFLEVRPDGTRRLFEFAPPPPGPSGTPVLPQRPPVQTRGEILALLREAGFVDVTVGTLPDLHPVGDDARVVVFLGRRPKEHEAQRGAHPTPSRRGGGIS